MPLMGLQFHCQRKWIIAAEREREREKLSGLAPTLQA